MHRFLPSPTPTLLASLSFIGALNESDKGPKHIYAKETINITLEGIEKIVTIKQCEQSREHLQVEWLLFFLQ